jgi:hypothetical protein
MFYSIQKEKKIDHTHTHTTIYKQNVKEQALHKKKKFFIFMTEQTNKKKHLSIYYRALFK